MNSTRKTYGTVIGIAVILALFICSLAVFLFTFLKPDILKIFQPSSIEEVSNPGPDQIPTQTYTFAPINRSTLDPTESYSITQTQLEGEPGYTPAPSTTLENPYILTPVSPEVNYRAPDFSLPNLSESKMVTLSNYLGKPVVIDYWAAWCPPCHEELPSIQTIYDEYHDQGLTVLAVDNIENDNAEDVSDFVDENNLTFEILLDDSGIVMQLYEIVYMPTTIFIDRYGIIRDIKIGSITEDEFRMLVQEIMSD